MCPNDDELYKYVAVNSADRVSGTVSDFQINLPYGLKARKIQLLSVVLPNSITSPTTNTHIFLNISNTENNVSTNRNTFTFCIPFLLNTVNVYHGEFYQQQSVFPKGQMFYQQQITVKLLDYNNAPVTFSSGEWSFLLKVIT